MIIYWNFVYILMKSLNNSWFQFSGQFTIYPIGQIYRRLYKFQSRSCIIVCIFYIYVYHYSFSNLIVPSNFFTSTMFNCHRWCNGWGHRQLVLLWKCNELLLWCGTVWLQLFTEQDFDHRQNILNKKKRGKQKSRVEISDILLMWKENGGRKSSDLCGGGDVGEVHCGSPFF